MQPFCGKDGKDAGSVEESMGSIYPLDRGRNLILYESGSALYLRTLAGEGTTQPITLCTDFAGNLSDAIYNGTLYYCYQNRQRDVVVRSIADLQELYRIDSREINACFRPRLAGFQNTLLIFYAVNNPIGNTYCLKVLFPFDARKRIMLPEKYFGQCPEINIMNLGNCMTVYAGDGASRLLLHFDADMSCTVMEDAAVHNERISLLERQLAEQTAIIESVKTQYEELMGTALKYKDEAAKWYEIARKKDSPPIPGERLLMSEW